MWNIVYSFMPPVNLHFLSIFFVLSIVVGARYDLKANPFNIATSKNFERKKMKQNLHFQIIK